MCDWTVAAAALSRLRISYPLLYLNTESLVALTRAQAPLLLELLQLPRVQVCVPAVSVCLHCVCPLCAAHCAADVCCCSPYMLVGLLAVSPYVVCVRSVYVFTCECGGGVWALCACLLCMRACCVCACCVCMCLHCVCACNV